MISKTFRTIYIYTIPSMDNELLYELDDYGLFIDGYDIYKGPNGSNIPNYPSSPSKHKDNSTKIYHIPNLIQPSNIWNM
jgi:hypothetical protein